jgi:hypothetical protein
MRGIDDGYGWFIPIILIRIRWNGDYDAIYCLGSWLSLITLIASFPFLYINFKRGTLRGDSFCEWIFPLTVILVAEFGLWNKFGTFFIDIFDWLFC